MQFRVLGLGLLQDGDVGLGVFPEGEEILVGRLSFGRVALRGMGSADVEMLKARRSAASGGAWQSLGRALA